MDHRRLDQTKRAARNTHDLELVEAFQHGRISRRDFVRRGAIIGLSAPFLGSVIAACGGDEDRSAGDGPDATGEEVTATTTTTTTTETTPARPEADGTIRFAVQRPAGALDPVNMQDLGAYATVAQMQEFLIGLAPDGTIGPMLATSWEPNEDGSVWTFNLREGVMFQGGEQFTSANVAATMDRLAAAENASLGNVIAVGAVDASDPLKAIFELEGPNGNFPFLVSLFNAQALITPVGYEPGTTLDGQPDGTGAWTLESYDIGTGARFVRNPDWWGGTTPLDAVELAYFDDIEAQVEAVSDGDLDAIVQFQVIGGDALFENPDFQVLGVQAATHRQIWMKTTTGPFADKRIRQALCLTFDRRKMIDELYRGRADLANDHVIAPFLPFFDQTQEQRPFDPDKARALLADAGAEGLRATLHCGDLQEIPDLADMIKASAAQAGFDLDLEVEASLDAFYDTRWCPPDGDPPCSEAAELGIVDYGHRPVPDTYLNASLSSGGVWNSSNYENPEYDAAIRAYEAAVGIDEQIAAAGAIQRILTEDCPIGVPYFYNYLAGHSRRFANVQVSALGQPVLQRATLL